MPLLLKTTTQTGRLYRQIVSTSMPEKPKALSPSTASTGLPVSIAAPMAKPIPMPMTPQVPTSRRLRGLIHVDDAAREIERVGAFVYEDGIRPLFDDGAQRTERAVVVHRRRILHQSRRHLGDVLFPLRIDGADPVSRRARPFAVHAGKQSRHARADIADHGCDDLDVAVHLLGLDVDLDEFLRMRARPRPCPCRATEAS